MKKTTPSHERQAFIRFLLASIILSSSFLSSSALSLLADEPSVQTNLQKVFVTATTALVTREPSPGSTTVVQLKAGDGLEILEIQASYAKVRYRIEGDYPVAGWIPLAVISKPSPNTPGFSEQNTQTYLPEPKQKVVTEVQSFPESKMPETVSIPKTESTNSPSVKSEIKNNKATKEISRRKNPGFQNELSLQAGLQSWTESLTTLQSTGAYYNAAFLEYDLTGPSIAVKDRISYRFQDLSLALDLAYQFTSFSDSVDSANEEVGQSSIQAQFHELEIHPLVRWELPKKTAWGFSIEGGPTLGYHSFITNPLHDISPTNPNRAGQPVLFNLSAIYFNFSLKPSLEMPFNLKFSPEVGVNFLYLFSEDPNVDAASDANKIRTGAPDGAGMNLQYGSELSWTADSLGFPNSELVFSILMKDFSRKYTGLGNRAGTQTNNVKADVSAFSYSLGFNYLF